MFDDIKKSINSTLYERATSPFWGALIISWIVSNWRIFYITFFESKESLGLSKIDYITRYLLNPYHLYVYPLICSFILLIIIPPIAYRAMYIPEYFKNKRKNLKKDLAKENLVDRDQLLNVLGVLDKQMESFKNLLHEDKLKAATITQLQDDNKKTSAQLNAKDAQISELNVRIQNNNDIIMGNRILNDIFTGIWRCTSVDSDGQSHPEDFYIREGNSYVLTKDANAAFYLTAVTYNVQSRVLTFKKETPNGTISVINKLFVRSPILIDGKEDETIPVKYERINDFNKLTRSFK